MQGFVSCSVCASFGDHATENCPRRAKRDLNEEGAAVMRDHRGEYNESDLLWTHPSSGSKLYIGNHTAAKNLEGLQSLKITHIVNCMARNTDCVVFEDRFSYFRFPVETWEGEMVRQGGDPGISDGGFCAAAYFQPLFQYVDEALAVPGSGVLVHCFAGAHRGAAGF